MPKGQVTTNWVGTGTSDDPFRPDLPAGVDQPDGNYGDPIVIAGCVAHFSCSQALHDTMEADINKVLMWSVDDEGLPIRDKGANPEQAEWSHTNSWLTQQNGMTANLRQAINGQTRHDFTRDEIADHMQLYVEGTFVEPLGVNGGNGNGPPG